MQNKPTTYTRNEPQPRTIQRVVAALAILGEGWHSVADIAAAQGRKKLWNSDKGVIVRLVAEGVLEQRLVTMQPTQVNRIEYRIVGDLPEIRSKDES